MSDTEQNQELKLSSEDTNQTENIDNQNEQQIDNPQSNIIDSNIQDTQDLKELDTQNVEQVDNTVDNTVDNVTSLQETTTDMPPASTTIIESEEKNTPVEESQEKTKSSDEIILKVDKSTLASLSQNLNSNLLVNIVAYKGVLTKLKDNETNSDKKSQLEKDITDLDKIQESVSSLMKNVQTNLDVPTDKIVSPEAVIEEALKSTSLADQLISAQVTSILASLAAAAVLAGGNKFKLIQNKKKYTKRKRNNWKKQTKKHN